MQIYARDHVEVHQQNRKEVLYLLKKKKEKNKQTNKQNKNNGTLWL